MSKTSGTERRQRKDVRRNLERVLQAAQELFMERGPDVTMEEVARRAGVGVGTIYRRFPSKEQLFEAISHAACDDMRSCFLEAAQAEHDAIGKLRTLIFIRYQHSQQPVTLIDFRPGNPHNIESEQADQDPAQLYTILHHKLQQVIIEGQDEGKIRQGDSKILAALCLELLKPSTIQNLQGVAGECTKEITEQVMAFVLEGLTSRS
ncbi:MAG: TetR/AcrR family transcriptional regulator [Chloroflexota bacterium]